MYLNKLTDDQKLAFLSISLKLINSDGILDRREQNAIDMMRIEMGLIEEAKLPTGSMEDILSVYDSNNSKIYSFIEWLALAYADDNFSGEEKKIIIGQDTRPSGEIIKKGATQIILDAYNANPSSMLAALKNFKQLEVNNKYLFLGDMFELGNAAEKEHQSIVNYIESNFKSNIFLIGENFFNTNTGENILKFSSFEDLIPVLETLKLSNANLLIKGSRGMALERILDLI